MKKLISLLLVVALISVAACGKGGNSGNERTGEGKIIGEDYFFIEERTAIGIEMNNILSFVNNENEAVLIGNSWDSIGYESTLKIVTFDLNGNLIKDIRLDKIYAEAAGIAPDGTIWLLRVNWGYADNESFIENINLEAFDGDGNPIKSVILNHQDISKEDLWGLSKTLIIGDDGHFYICFDTSLTQGFSGVFDESGELVFNFTEADGYRTKSIVKLPDGRIVAQQINAGSTDSSSVFKVIDIERKGYAKDYLSMKNDGNPSWFEIFFTNGNGEYDFLRCEKTTIYGINYETGEASVLAKFGQDFTYDNLHKYAVFTGSSILKLENDPGRGINIMKYIITDTLPETNKIKLTLGLFFDVNMVVERTVSDFNRYNPDYEIEVKVYMPSGYGFAEALSDFNLDLITGNMPDIMIIHVTTEMPVNSYFDKGVFEDLYEYIDADPDMKRDDYVTSVLKYLETDEKLYTISDSFNIQTLIGKTSLVGTDMGWTWTEFFEFLDRNPDAVPLSTADALFSNIYFVLQMIINSIDTFIDAEAGISNFDSPEFLAILEYAKRFPDQSVNNYMNVSDYRTDSRLLLLTHIRDFRYYDLTKFETFFGEEITYKGFPTNDGGSGSLFYLQRRFGISSKSEHKEGAWEYIKYVMTDYQYLKNSQGVIDEFPVKKDALEIKAQTELAYKDVHMEIYGGMYEDGGVPVVDIYGAGNNEIKFTEETDIQKIYDLIDSMTKSWRGDYSAVTGIVQEEVSAYFAGQKTAGQVVDIIQNRVGIYLAELK